MLGVDVADELVFTVSGAEAKPVRATTLPEIGLSERQHLQEWVLAHPEILGPGIKVVTFEFDRWWAAGGDPLDRLDVLGLDRSGRLVVAELKRDAAPDTVEMQALKYAAMASRFTPETLGHQHARFRRDRGDSVTEEAALADLEEHTDDKTLAVETLRQPRIVLLAASFPPVVTATAVWLREMGLDITLMRFQAYQTDTETLVTVSQLLPVPTVEEFTVVPRGNVRAAAGQEYSDVPLSTGEFQDVGVSVDQRGHAGRARPVRQPGRRVGDLHGNLRVHGQESRRAPCRPRCAHAAGEEDGSVRTAGRLRRRSCPTETTMASG